MLVCSHVHKKFVCVHACVHDPFNDQIVNGSCQWLKNYLLNPPTIFIRRLFGMRTLMLEAVMSGNMKQVQFLLAQSRRIVAAGFDVPADLNVNGADRSGVAPLHTAVLKGNLPMVKLLLEAGADCLSEDSLGLTPLALAQSKQGSDIALAIQIHLSSHRAKSPKSRFLAQSDVNLGTQSAGPSTADVTDKYLDAAVAHPSIVVSSSPWSRSSDHRSRRATGKLSTSSGELLNALSVSSVKLKSAVTASKPAITTTAASACGAACQHLVGGASLSLNPIMEVPRDAILDFKLWMKQKQAATAPITSLVSLSEVPETIAEDDEVCAVNRSVLRTGCAKRPGTFQRPVTPTVYGGCIRSASATPVTAVTASGHHQQPVSTAPSKAAWLQAPQQSSTSRSNVLSSSSHAGSKLARVSGAMKTKLVLGSSVRVAEEFSLLPSSFLPRELDPLEATRLQEQRQLAALQQRILAYEQESRALTPAAFSRLKRRILGASACDDEMSAAPFVGGDVLSLDPDITAASSAFRPKLQAGLRLRRLVL
jgi:hypothetical protein